MFYKSTWRGLIAMAFLVSATKALADNITYDIVDYPASETDSINPGTDELSGTITTNGASWPVDERSQRQHRGGQPYVYFSSRRLHIHQFR